MGIEGIEKIVRAAAGMVAGTVIVVGAVAVVTGLVFGIKSGLETNRIKREYTQTYHQALLDHADTNHNGLVSRAEQDEFDRNLLKDKGVTLFPNTMPRYKDGTVVPCEVVTEWIRDYKPPE